MARPDTWARRARDAGYRSRAAYKLRQLDDEFGLISAGDIVVDLGAAPGGWMQVAAEGVGQTGAVIGVDRRRIDPLEDATDARVTTIRGDLTDSDTIDRLVDELDGGADLVLSDMAPDMSGDYDLDHARSIYLAGIAADIAREVLAPGGDFVVKVFEGRDLREFRSKLETDFGFVATARPPATRDASSEVYLVCKDRITAPVAVGDRLTVEIVDVGSEGDGIAKIDGFTLFVSGASTGDSLEIEVTDLKPRFGFARPVR